MEYLTCTLDLHEKGWLPQLLRQGTAEILLARDTPHTSIDFHCAVYVYGCSCPVNKI